MTLKGLRVEVIRSRYYAPSPDHTSPSETVSEATLIGVDGSPLHADSQVFEPTDDAPAVVIEHNAPNHMRARWADFAHGKWVMASGAWIHSGDSRFHENVGTSYPIPLHDRIERR